MEGVGRRELDAGVKPANLQTWHGQQMHSFYGQHDRAISISNAVRAEVRSSS